MPGPEPYGLKTVPASASTQEAAPPTPAAPATTGAAAAASAGLEANLEKLGEAHEGNVVSATPTHRAECGVVGQTGEHGDLGTNAAK